MSHREDLSDLGIFSFDNVEDIPHLEFNTFIDSDFKCICVDEHTDKVRFYLVSRRKIPPYERNEGEE